MTEAERYLAAVAANVRGPDASRLAIELRDHLEDAVAAEIACGADPDVAAEAVIQRLGTVQDVLAAWESRIRRRRAASRRRATFVAFAVATASALGIVQHASGHRPPRQTCVARHASADTRPAVHQAGRLHPADC